MTCCAKLSRALLALVVIAPLIVSMVMELRLVQTLNVTFGVYALLVSVHFVLQVVFSMINRRDMNRISDEWEVGSSSMTTVGIQVVGYQESPEKFAACCAALNEMQRLHPMIVSHIVCVVDGNEDEHDRAMLNTFIRIFPDALHLNLDHLPAQAVSCGDDEPPPIALIITQPHDGKRSAMRTAMMQQLQNRVDYIMLVDSDTVVNVDAPLHLRKVLDHYPDVGAVAGDIRIHDADSFLTLLIRLKYFMAFNLERSAQSAFGVVNCVGGPLGLYRADVIAEVLEPWFNQTFCGKKCTYGDDRHLTNQVLALGKSVKYTHRAYSYTDTPKSVRRWALQQTRWNKSGLREFWITARHLHKHSWWLTFDLIFIMFYSFFIVVIYAVIMLQFDIVKLTVLYAVIMLTSLARSLFGTFIEFTPLFLLMSFYGFLYIHILLPTKIWASLTLWSTAWGTSGRSIMKDGCSGLFPILVWNAAALTGIGYTFYADRDNVTSGLAAVWYLFVFGTVLLAAVGKEIAHCARSHVTLSDLAPSV